MWSRDCLVTHEKAREREIQVLPWPRIIVDCSRMMIDGHGVGTEHVLMGGVPRLSMVHSEYGNQLLQGRILLAIPTERPASVGSLARE